MLLLIRHANAKSKHIAIIVFLLTAFSMKTCTNFSPTFSGQANNFNPGWTSKWKKIVHAKRLLNLGT